jgi:predicted dinucleotide-binding enzyme
MSYAIVGFGKIGQALAHAFARKNIDVTVASRRPAPGELIIQKPRSAKLRQLQTIIALPLPRRGWVFARCQSRQNARILVGILVATPLMEATWKDIVGCRISSLV